MGTVLEARPWTAATTLQRHQKMPLVTFTINPRISAPLSSFAPSYHDNSLLRPHSPCFVMIAYPTIHSSTRPHAQRLWSRIYPANLHRHTTTHRIAIDRARLLPRVFISYANFTKRTLRSFIVNKKLRVCKDNEVMSTSPSQAANTAVLFAHTSSTGTRRKKSDKVWVLFAYCGASRTQHKKERIKKTEHKRVLVQRYLAVIMVRRVGGIRLTKSDD